MKSKWFFIGAIFQLVVGICGILSFVFVWGCGENMTKWIFTLILSVVLVFSGIVGIVNYKSNKL